MEVEERARGRLDWVHIELMKMRSFRERQQDRSMGARRRMESRERKVKICDPCALRARLLLTPKKPPKERTHHVVESLKDRCPANGKHLSNQESTNESFHSFLRTQADEWSSTKEHSTNIGEDIITNDQACWDP